MNEHQFVDVDPWGEPGGPPLEPSGTAPAGQVSSAGGGLQTSTIKERVLKMSSILDCQDESELLPPSNDDVNRWTQSYVTMMGSLPDPSEEPIFFSWRH